MNEKIYNIYKVQKWMKYLPILFTFHFSLFTSSAASAQKPDSIRVFDDEHPLVYEDAWDLWPYVFLNENGEPDGYNIDLLKMIFKRLNIPYIAPYGCLVLQRQLPLQQHHHPAVHP